MARFLAYTAPERGHLYPVVPTLLELRRRGHHVAVRTMSEELSSLRELGLDAAAVAPEIEAREPDDWQARTPVGAVRRDVRAIAERARHEIPDLRRAVAETAPDALFVDATSWGAATAAEALGLPWAYALHFCLPIPRRTRRRTGSACPRMAAGAAGCATSWPDGWCSSRSGGSRSRN
jgi:UDP:flavonoid glycosyltransferase YjiC (YdhE family)